MQCGLQTFPLYFSNLSVNHILFFMTQSREDVTAILNRYEVSLNAFFENEEDAKPFAKDQVHKTTAKDSQTETMLCIGS